MSEDLPPMDDKEQNPHVHKLQLHGEKPEIPGL